MQGRDPRARMDCRTVRDRLFEFLDDELRGDVRSGVERHLDACAPCRDHAARERSFLAAVRAKCPKGDCPETVRARIADEIRRRRESSSLS